MTSKFTLRSLLFALLAMGMISVAKADFYIYVNQDTHSVAKNISVPGHEEASWGPDLPVESWYVSSEVLYADIDATMATGTYFVGSVHDGTWGIFEDVYVVIQ